MTDLTLSFEFFPPRSPEASAKLDMTLDKLAPLAPDYFSCTFGAGGSTRDSTFETITQIKQRTGITAAPHVSCIGFPVADIRRVLDQYREAGVTRVVALRGDMPSGTTGFGELRFANELVEFIRAETGDAFHIEVAAYPEVHPQANSAAVDLQNFVRKVEAGADSAITQYFYNPDAYFRFVDAATAKGVNIPIVPGIMPITNYSQLRRFSDMCGAEIPRWLDQRLRDFGDDRNSIRAFGTEVTIKLCEALIQGGAPGLHIYSMNQSESSVAIWDALNLAAMRT